MSQIICSVRVAEHCEAMKPGILYRLSEASPHPSVLQAIACKDDGVAFYTEGGPAKSPTLQATGFVILAFDCIATGFVMLAFDCLD